MRIGEKLADVEENRIKADTERKNQAKNLKLIERSVYFSNKREERSPSMKGIKSGGDQIPLSYRSKLKISTEGSSRKNSIGKSNTRIFESTDSIDFH
jgi:hypothetical protein